MQVLADVTAASDLPRYRLGPSLKRFGNKNTWRWIAGLNSRDHMYAFSSCWFSITQESRPRLHFLVFNLFNLAFSRGKFHVNGLVLFISVVFDLEIEKST